jgi:hypothetical protein
MRLTRRFDAGTGARGGNASPAADGLANAETMLSELASCLRT